MIKNLWKRTHFYCSYRHEPTEMIINEKGEFDITGDKTTAALQSLADLINVDKVAPKIAGFPALPRTKLPPEQLLHHYIHLAGNSPR